MRLLVRCTSLTARLSWQRSAKNFRRVDLLSVNRRSGHVSMTLNACALSVCGMSVKQGVAAIRAVRQSKAGVRGDLGHESIDAADLQSDAYRFVEHLRGLLAPLPVF